MTILDTIVENKRIEIQEAKEQVTVEELKAMPFFGRRINSLKAALTGEGSSGIISEFKRKSPSKGDIHKDADVAEITSGYAAAGAAGVSVLTDTSFFGGAKGDLLTAREHNPDLAILRKDFMVDTYQMYEAKAWGADVILLIAACLPPNEIKKLSQKAHELNLEVLLEVHDEAELKSSPLANVDIIGVNNRNLKNFAESNINASLELVNLIPAGKVKISESCISDPNTVKELRAVGYQGFLVGENFMKTDNPPRALEKFIVKITK